MPVPVAAVRRQVVAVLVLGVVLAGCSGAEGPTPEGNDDGDGERRSVGATGGTDAPHDTVRFFEGTLDLVGPASQSFDVVVPANVTVVESHLAWSTAAQFVDLRVELTGCGAYAMGLGSSTVGNAGTRSARLCEDASDGAATLTVGNTGFLQGTISLSGHVPRANATAPA